MGGNAFKQDGLLTPRMQENIYVYALNTCKAKLRTIYAHVDSAIEGPGKTDHGDVDIAVVAHDSQALPTKEQVAVLLGADAVKKVGGSNTTNFAIPWPAAAGQEPIADLINTGVDSTTEMLLGDELEKLSLETNMGASDGGQNFQTRSQTDAISSGGSNNHLQVNNPKQTSPDARYIQVDVHISSSLSALRMLLFVQAHGDFWSIIGTMIRRLGLTCSESGFYIRIAEIESHSKKLCRIELTNDPSKILAFLGFDESIYWNRFETQDDMMDYASTCRFYDPFRGGDKAFDQLKIELKHNDRQRTLKRPTFQLWFDEYIPNHQDAKPGTDSQMTRDDVVQEAFHFFGKEVQQEFEERKRTTMRLMGIEKLWADIRKQIPVEGIEIGEVMRGLKRIIVTEAEGCRLEELTMVQKAYFDGHWDQISDWVMRNWEEVGKSQRRVEKEKCAVHFAKGSQRKINGKKSTRSPREQT